MKNKNCMHQRDDYFPFILMHRSSKSVQKQLRYCLEKVDPGHHVHSRWAFSVQHIKHHHIHHKERQLMPLRRDQERTLTLGDAFSHYFWPCLTRFWYKTMCSRLPRLDDLSDLHSWPNLSHLLWVSSLFNMLSHVLPYFHVFIQHIHLRPANNF